DHLLWLHIDIALHIRRLHHTDLPVRNPVMATHKRNGLVIQTEHVNPPIATRQYDWSAVLDDYDGAPDAGDQPSGWGPTEQAAIADLLDLLARTQLEIDRQTW